MTGSERKSKDLHENEEGTGEKPRCRKMQGQNVKGAGELHENEGGTEKNQDAGRCKKLLEIVGNEEQLMRNEGMCRKLT